MDVHVRVDIDEDGPVVIKTATGSAVERLRLEHQRLTRAVHPGVVALARRQPQPGPARPGPASDGLPPEDRASPGDTVPPGEIAPPRDSVPSGDPADADDLDAYVLRTRYAGEPVSRWTGTVNGIAGLGAAVAGTLADLHALGIVHGRIDSGHILIGDDGRPRLCGLSHPGDAAPADDVAALGDVLDGLLARAPAGRRRRPRGSSGATRALRQVIERATDPIPTRRTSAGALADAILAAVPAADLPAPAGSPRLPQPGPRRGGATTGDAGGYADDDAGAMGADPGAAAAAHGAAQPDTLDRIWSFAGEQSDDERWAAAFGSGPRDLRPSGGAEDTRPSTPGAAARGVAAPPPLPIAALDTPAWPTTRDDRATDATSRLAEHDLGIDGPDDLSRRRDGCDWPDDGPDRSAGVDDDRPSPSTGADAGDRQTDHPRIDDRWDDGVSDELLTRDHRVPVARVARPPRRPGDDDAQPSSGRSRRLAIVATVAFATCLAVAGAVLVGIGGDDTDSPRSEVASPTADCPPAAAPAADVDGDGCVEALVVDGGTVDAGVARWSLGQPGDIVTVGDWDCNGEASAALLRPTTGDVFVFSAWAPSDEPVTVGASQRVDGGTGLRAEPSDGGCDQLVVDRADGTTATVEVPR